MPDVERTLSEAGYRVTGSRRAVAEVLARADGPLSHQEILERGRRIHPDLGLVTVYRTLDLFAELGLTRRVHGEEGCASCMPSSPGHHHALVCTKCGSAIEFPCEDGIAELVAKVEQETDFRVSEHLLQLSGVCGSCRETPS